MKADGHTVLLTTHDIDEAESLCDRIAVIDKGRIAAIGATREIVARSSAEPIVSVTTTRPLDPAALAALDGCHESICDGARAQFRTGDPNRSIAALVALLDAQGIRIVDLSVHTASLEDVFLELTGSPLSD
jgi:ABC-2 type transport system ATP-binding protein